MTVMSSPLPAVLKRDVVNEATRPSGKVRCAGCHKDFPRPHTHVDHVVPEWKAPERAHDRDNLQVLCAPPAGGGCHQAKTSREARQRARRAGRRAWTPTRLVLPLILIFAALSTLGYLLVKIGGGDLDAYADQVVFRYLWWLNLVVVSLLAWRPLVGLGKWWLTSTAREPSATAQPAVAAPPVDPAVKAELRIAAAAREQMPSVKGTVTVSNLVYEGERLMSFVVAYPDTGAPDHQAEWRVSFMERITAKLGEARWLPAWQTDLDVVKIRRRPDLAPVVPHPGFPADKPWYLIPVADEVSYDLRVTSHLLIVGATNAGKTALMRAIIMSFLHSARHGDAKVWLGDPKLIEMLGFRDAVGVGTLATTDEALWDLALDTKAEMMRRYAMIEAGEAVEEDFPPLLVLIDEYEDYVDRMETYFITSGKKKSGMKCPAILAMKSVLRMARRCRIHLVIGTQRPDAVWFGGNARDNLQGRACVGMATAELSRMCFGDSSYGRDVPITLKGRTTFQIGDGAPVEEQAYWVPDPHKATSSADLAILVRLGQ